MASFHSSFDELIRRGMTGVTQDRDTIAARDGRLLAPDATQVTDPNVDHYWGGFQASGAPNAYWDYYFSGQDIRIYIDGTEDDPEFKVLPLVEMAFNVEQKKQPVYGFWSYTYDAVMRGTRVVSGAFTLVTRYPDYMKRVLVKAAESRARGQSSYRSTRDLTEDDENIEKYWGKNLDPAALQAGKHIFSVHPPFSLVVVYGIQNLSLSDLSVDGQIEIRNAYNSDNPLMTDLNERLVEVDSVDQTNRIILDACELTGVQRAITSDGSVLTETYSFFARDILSQKPKSTGTMAAGLVPGVSNRITIG
jgi:hypothetical protein